MDNFLKLLQNEFKHFLKNKPALAMLFIVPTFLTFFFGGLYSQHKVTEVKIAVVDEDNTSLSRTLTENFDRSEKLHVTEHLTDSNEINTFLNDNRVDGVILIPPNFMKDIKRSMPVEVGVFLDGSNMLIGNTLLSGANEVIQTTQVGLTIKILEGMGNTPQKSKNIAQLVQFRNRTWYNPTFSYIYFMLLGLFGAVIQQVTLFQSAQSFIRDKINGVDVFWQEAGMSFGAYYLAKSLFYWLASAFNCMLCLTVAKTIFGVPIKGDPLTLFVLIAVFSAAVTSLGFLFSIIAKTEMLANQYAMLVASPAFLISGFTWPFFAMPLFFQWLGKSIPLTHFLLALRAVALRGSGIEVIMPYINILLAMTMFFASISLVILSRRWGFRVMHAKPALEVEGGL
jgi:ABC-2 type transport system permease protein